MKKGFTLIELLAVIVILSVIALIITPMILNVIDNAKKGSAEASAYGYVEAVEKQSLNNKINGGEQLADNVYDVKVENITVKGEPPKEGWFVIEKGEVTNYSFLINGYIVTKGKKTVKGLKVEEKPTGGIPKDWSYIDSDSDGKVNVGDEIKYKTESFYITSNDGTNIKALSKYNLYVGGSYNSNSNLWNSFNKVTGLQDSTMLGLISGQTEYMGTMNFSSNGQKGYYFSDYVGSKMEEYVKQYKATLEEMGAKILNASLITTGELESLGCDSRNAYTCAAAPAFITSSSYWTGSPNGPKYVFCVSSDKIFNGYHYDTIKYFGVRPLITISLSEI